MIKYLLLIATCMVSISTFAQNNDRRDTLHYIFIGEIRLDYVKQNANKELQSIPYRDFVRDYKLRLYVNEGGRLGNELPQPELKKKETYYWTDPSELDRVEVRIRAPKNKFNSALPVVAAVISRSNNAFVSYTRPFLLEPLANGENNITKDVFKMNRIIPIAEPAVIGVGITLSYLKSHLDSASAYGFRKTLFELQRFKENFSQHLPLTNDQLKDFYRLLDFIEPYLVETSFLNNEAQKLQFEIARLRSMVAEMNITSDGKTNINSDSLRAALTFRDSIYNDYSQYYAKLRSYRDQLELILFLQTPSQQRQEKKPHIPQTISLAAGTGINSYLSSRYNVTTSPTDTTVQFETLSRWSPAVYAGVVWHPGLDRAPDLHPDRLTNREPHASSSWAVGAFLYYDVFSTRTEGAFLGGSIGVGFVRSRISFMTTLAARSIRAPREFFTAEFKDQNKKLGTPAQQVNINDNSIFVDRVTFSVGIMVCYLL